MKTEQTLNRTFISIGMLLIFTTIAFTSLFAQRSRKPKAQNVTIELTENGYEPYTVRLRSEVPAKLTFIRKVSATCATEVLIPEYGIKRALPLNEPVVVEFTPNKSGRFSFSCGMGMLRGSLIVR